MAQNNVDLARIFEVVTSSLAENQQALAQTFLGQCGMGAAQHCTQSTQIVVDSFLKALGGMNK